MFLYGNPSHSNFIYMHVSTCVPCSIICCCDADGKWQKAVLKSYQDMVLEADKQRQQAVTDARIAMDEVELLSTRLRALERAKEEAVQAAALRGACLALCTSHAAKSTQLSQRQAEETLTAQADRISALHKQLSQALCQVQVMSQEAIAASAPESERVEEIQSLSHALKDLRTQLHCVTSECNSLKMQASSHPTGCDNQPDAVAARDAAIKDYFLSSMLPQLKQG
jgi:chromosome segregation ATPase